LVELLLEDLKAQTVRPQSIHVIVNNAHAGLPPRPWHRAEPGRVEVDFLTPGHYFAKGVNVALRQVRTEYVAVVNDDVRLQPTWLEAVMEGLVQHPEYGSIASRVVSLRHPGLLDSCGDSAYLSGWATANAWLEPDDGWTEAREVFSASGCLATYRTADILRAGLFDETFVAYMEDVDLGFRMQLLGRPACSGQLRGPVTSEERPERRRALVPGWRSATRFSW
jgi:GT2 family glycosyltransferase